MKNNTRPRTFFLVIAISLCTEGLVSCRGLERCVDETTAIDDIDGDCLPNEDDLCPTVSSNAFGGQVDSDEDGLGAECDENDWADTCGTINDETDGDCFIAYTSNGQDIWVCGDCVPPATDNCDAAYNPGQTDADEDGVGCVCDSNDSSGTVTTEMDYADYNYACDETEEESSRILPLASLDSSFGAYDAPMWRANELSPQALDTTSCDYFLRACNGGFLGYLGRAEGDPETLLNKEGPYGDPASDISILNPIGFYGRSFTSCSAFNPDAPYPPAIYCARDGAEELAGYLTLNPHIPGHIDACEIATNLGLGHPECSE